jgi:hypothetical protein
MNVVSGHSLESFGLDERPELGKGAVNDHGVHCWIDDLDKQIFSIDDLHGVSLGGTDESMVLLLLNLESLLFVAVHYLSDSMLVDVLMAFSSHILHHLFKRNITAGVNGESFLLSTMPQDPGHGLGDSGVFVAAIFPVLAFTLHVEN